MSCSKNYSTNYTYFCTYFYQSLCEELGRGDLHAGDYDGYTLFQEEWCGNASADAELPSCQYGNCIVDENDRLLFRARDESYDCTTHSWRGTS